MQDLEKRFAIGLLGKQKKVGSLTSRDKLGKD